jgi:hypothetical protein
MILQYINVKVSDKQACVKKLLALCMSFAWATLLA